MGDATETYETGQPWVIYTYGRTHDGWWPLWNSTRVLGRSRIGMECCVCGHTGVATIRIPRFGPVPVPESGRHPVRERFLTEHAHPDRGHPMSWARPLRNPAFGVDLDLLTMRLQADAAGPAPTAVDPALLGTWADPEFRAHQDHRHPVDGCGYCPSEEDR
jgi:hypothetical protein